MDINFPNSTSSGSNVENSQQVRAPDSKPERPAGSSGIAEGASGAEVTLSETGVQALKAHLANLPSVRQDRVQALQQAVQNGTYQVSTKQVAEAIHSDLFGSKSSGS